MCIFLSFNRMLLRVYALDVCGSDHFAVTWLSSLPNWAGELRLCQHCPLAKMQALTQTLTFPCFYKISSWHYPPTYDVVFLLEHYLHDPEIFHPKRKQGLWKKKKFGADD